MPDIAFAVERAEVMRESASPTFAFHLRITNAVPAEPVHAILLRCQIQIETPRRRYSPREKDGLRDLFGEPERWGQTLRPMLWSTLALNIPAFTGSTEYPMPVPCTFDFSVAATKYFYGLQDGDIPLIVFFSGTVFYHAEKGLQAAPVCWNQESRFRLPVQLWRQMMDAYYPNTAWLCLPREVFDRLYSFKVQEGIATLGEALSRVLNIAGIQREVS